MASDYDMCARYIAMRKHNGKAENWNTTWLSATSLD